MSSLRIIVCPHELDMGGSQINAIELASKLQDQGHQVLVFSPDGHLSSRVAELGLEHVVSPAGDKPTLGWMRALGRLARSWNADIVHTYEWGPSLGALWRLFPFTRTRLLMTVLSMHVPKFLPLGVPLVVGTEQIRRDSLPRKAPVYLMEPPIDTEFNSPEAVASEAMIGVAPGQVVVCFVCRMTEELDKAAGVIQAIESLERLSDRNSVNLLLAGDGECMPKIRAAASAANWRLGREAVVLLGNMNDPRSVYASSDICLGMGSSAIKALAFGKPLIVQGELGYWKLLDPETLPEFERQGFYGSGGAGSQSLVDALDTLCAHAELRDALGRWGRELVEERYSLSAAAEQLEQIYRQTCDSDVVPLHRVADICRSTFEYCSFLLDIKVRARLRSWTVKAS